MATIITYPYIMAKVRLQWKPKDSSRKELLYKGILDVMQKVYRQEGIPGLFNGIKAQIIKAVMAQALLFMMKDELDRNVWLISLALYRLLPAPVVQTNGKKEL
jgi:adenine nucleotide transporter 17